MRAGMRACFHQLLVFDFESSYHLTDALLEGPADFLADFLADFMADLGAQHAISMQYTYFRFLQVVACVACLVSKNYLESLLTYIFSLF